MRRPRGPLAAFTLLEMLVALSITAILAGALYASLHAALGARKRTEAAVRPVRAATIALELIRRDLDVALPPTGVLAGAFIGSDGTTETGGEDGDSIAFYCLADALGGDGVRKVELALAPSEDGEDNVLVRRVTENLLAPETPEPTEETLSRRVTSLNFRYFDGAAWADSWDSGTAGNVLPVAVEAVIALRPATEEASETEAYKLTRVFMLPCGVPPEAGGEGALASGSQQRR